MKKIVKMTVLMAAIGLCSQSTGGQATVLVKEGEFYCSSGCSYDRIMWCVLCSDCSVQEGIPSATPDGKC